jgi:hypothetical protein
LSNTLIVDTWVVGLSINKVVSVYCVAVSVSSVTLSTGGETTVAGLLSPPPPPPQFINNGNADVSMSSFNLFTMIPLAQL